MAHPGPAQRRLGRRQSGRVAGSAAVLSVDPATSPVRAVALPACERSTGMVRTAAPISLPLLSVPPELIPPPDIPVSEVVGDGVCIGGCGGAAGGTGARGRLRGPCFAAPAVAGRPPRSALRYWSSTGADSLCEMAAAGASVVVGVAAAFGVLLPVGSAGFLSGVCWQAAASFVPVAVPAAGGVQPFCGVPVVAAGSLLAVLVAVESAEVVVVPVPEDVDVVVVAAVASVPVVVAPDPVDCVRAWAELDDDVVVAAAPDCVLEVLEVLDELVAVEVETCSTVVVDEAGGVAVVSGSA